MMEMLEYGGFAVLRWCAGRLSFRGAGRLGKALGSAVFLLTPFRKRVTLENLRRAFPERTGKELRDLALEAYENFGITFLEMLWSGRQPAGELMRVVELRNSRAVEARLREGGGIIILSGHFGNWEFILQGVRLRLGVPVATIVQRQRNGRVDAALDAIRTRFGNRTISMGVASREAVRILKGGGVLCVLGDQSGPRESVFVDFFGRPAATHRGVAAFALRIGVPLVMVYVERHEDGTYEALFEEVPLPAGTGEDAVTELTRTHAAMLERRIRMHPGQWLWMHKRWKHREPLPQRGDEA
ncbi:MAG: lysophospholipid acyltransferase family protein [Bacteroidota bacterium]